MRQVSNLESPWEWSFMLKWIESFCLKWNTLRNTVPASNNFSCKVFNILKIKTMVSTHHSILQIRWQETFLRNLPWDSSHNDSTLKLLQLVSVINATKACDMVSFCPFSSPRQTLSSEKSWVLPGRTMSKTPPLIPKTHQ